MKENQATSININTSKEFQYKVISCLRNALEEDVVSFKQSTNLVTNNGLRMLKGDYINTHLQNELSSEDIEVVPFSRYGWGSRIVINHANKTVYNVISKSRLQQLMKTAAHNSVPHYAMLFAYTLNADIKAENKQITMFEGYPFSDKIMTEGYNKLLGGQLQKNLGYKYCVITYEVSNSQLFDCEIILLDRDLDVVSRESLSEFITPNYSTLTQSESINADGEETNKRVKLKNKNATSSNTLVTLKSDDQVNRA